MSKEIDERVVEMRFDNEHFEKNVQTSMSTLDKFKQKLQFKNADKGFNDVEKAAKNTDLSPLAKSADKVGLRFNAMYTVADQAFRNITNSAMAAGKRIVDALTIDPIKTGLSEYETKVNSVQVIKANTRGKYETEAEQMEVIYKALDELNDYADRTIYNYTQMTDNVGKFVAQTGDVEKSVKAVQGLANLAGASGASAADMARATYQMSQALSGTIRKIDWNSLRNANMAGMELKNMLIDLAKVEGIDIDSMISSKGTFEDTLEEGWLTGDLFMKAMNIYSDAYSEAELAAMGFNEAQIANFKDLAKTAQEATTEVKTFTQLFDVLVETAQSGWTQTWEIVFGDFDTAKKMFTELQIYFSDILNKFSASRNMLLEGALNLKNPWSKIWEKLENSSVGKVVKTFDKVSSSVENATDRLDYFQKVVTDVWRGDYKNSDTGRYDLLEGAGYNHKVVQDLVNKGYQYKLTIEDIEESHKKFGLTLDGNAESLETTGEVASAAGEAAEVATDKFKEITDEQLIQAGLTEEEIKLYRALADEAERTGVKLSDLIAEMSENNGRTMLIDSAKNAWSGLVTILTAVRDAWVDIFPPMTIIQLYNIIKAVKEFSEHLVVHEETAENLTRTLKGLFAALDIILTAVSLPVKIAFKLLTQLLGVLDIDILSVTAALGDMLVGFRDTVDAALDFTSVLKKIVPPIQNAIKAFRGWIDTLKESENLPKDIAEGITRWFSKAVKAVTGWFSNLGGILQNGFGDVSDNAILGLINGLWNGLKVAGEVIVTLGKTLIDKICEVLGIHSPSVVFFAIGGFIVSGLLMGIKAFFPEVFATISGYATHCVDIIKSIDFGSVFSAVLSSVTAVALLKFADAVQNMGAMFDGVGEMLEDVGVGVKRALTGLKSALKGIGASFRAKAIKDVAISLAILAASLVVLSLVPTDKLLWATGAIAVLGIVLGGLFVVLNKTTGGLKGKEAFSKIGALILTMIGISASIFILAKALETLSNVDFVNNWKTILLGISTIVITIGLIMTELALVTKFMKDKDFAKLAISISALAGLFLIMAISVKILGGLDGTEFSKAISFIGAFGAIVVKLTGLSTTQTNRKVAATSGMIKNIGVAMLLMAVTCKIVAGMSWTELGKAAVGILGFTAIAVGLMAISKLATDKDVSNAGKLISSVGAAMLLMTIAGKIIATMTWEDMFKAMIGIAALGLIISGLIAATNLASGKELAKVGTTILMVSIAVGVLALIASLLSFMNLEHLAKGITAVSMLGAIMAGMILATSKAQNCLGNLIVMTISIALMASAVATLSLIDTAKLATSTGAMVAMMASFAAILAATKFVNKEALGSLIVLTVIVGILAGIVALLSLINADKALTSTLALVALMSAMTVLLVVLGTIKIDVANAIVGIIGLTAMVIPLAVFAIALAALPSLAGKEKEILILVGVMTVMTVLLLLTAAVGAIYMATSGIAATGLIGLAAMAGLMWIFSLALANLKDFSANIPIIETLIEVMTTMTDLLVKVAIVGPLAVIGVGALAALSALMVGFGVFATGVGALVTKFPQLKTFLDTGIPIFEQLAHGLGSIISNFLTGLLSGLPEVGTLLSEFMSEAQGFIDGVKNVDGDVLKGIGTLVGAFTALLGMDFIASIEKFFSFGKSPFAGFGEGLSEMATIITDFANAMSSFTDDQLEAVKRGASALKYIAEAAASIPNSGGVAGYFAGENDIDEFIKMVVGSKNKKGVKELVECLSGIEIDDSTVDDIKLVSKIIATLSGAANDIPNSGGVSGFFAGNNDLDDFIKMVVGNPDKGVRGVKDLVDCLASIDIDNGTVDDINQTIAIINAVINSSNTISNSASINFSSFGTNIVTFANKFKTFVDKMSVIKTDSIADSISKVNELVELCGKFTSDSVKNISDFGKAISNVAKGGINEFVKAFTSTKSTTDATSAINEFLDNVISKVKAKTNKQKFSRVGKYLIEGLRDGIVNNSSIVSKAVRNVVEDALAAAQDEADINSPSLVFNKEVGRYIVQGIAEGIKKDMSAEESAKQKAQNIVTAFQNEIDKYDIGSTISEKEFELWLLGDGKKASSVDKEAKQLEYLNGELSRKRTIETLRHDEWKETSSQFGANSKEEREAWSKYLDAQKEVLSIQTQITDLISGGKLSRIDHDMEMLRLNYDNWVINAPDAKQSVKQSKLYELLDRELDLLKEKEEINRQAFNDISNNYNSDSAEYIAAYETWVRSKADVYAKEEEISDTHEQHLLELKEADDRVRESTYDLWRSENADASDRVKLLKEAEYLENCILDAEEDIVKIGCEYRDLLEDGNADAAEINNKLAELNEAKKKQADLEQQLNDNEDDILSLVRERQDIASDIAKIKYDIWEKTEGRDATDAEKETKKLEYLNQQALIQNKTTNEALKEYTKAVSEHGPESIEATRAYKAYLEEVYSLAELKNQILDLEESAADRQKRLADKQDQAAKDYDEYIKKYEKYYTANGMSRDDLEKDAKLVTGYDPASVVTDINSKAQTSFSKLKSSPLYQNTLTSFSNMGTSYITAVNEGINSQSDELMTNVTEIGFQAGNKLASTKPTWNSAGLQLVEGLIEGINAGRSQAINAAYSLAVQMLAAARAALAIRSPSREFAEIGKYSVLGLVKGLADNSGLSDEAAANIGTSAIETLKSTIGKISEVINSDLDTQPTIRPVLDLSNIRSGTARLNAMMSTEQAMAISASRKTREHSDENQNGNDSSTNTGNTYQFTQNNYSPKALSRTEIYRQTKNQFAAMKEVLV